MSSCAKPLRQRKPNGNNLPIKIGINLNNSEALISLSSQQTKDLFSFFAQTFRIPHTMCTVRAHINNY